MEGAHFRRRSCCFSEGERLNKKPGWLSLHIYIEGRNDEYERKAHSAIIPTYPRRI